MSSTEQTLDLYLRRIEHRERRARRVTIVALTLSAMLGLALAVYGAVQLNRAVRASAEARAAQATAERAREEARDAAALAAREQQRLRQAREAVFYVTQGINAFHQGAYARAVTAYDEALRRDPDNGYVLNLKGYALFKARRPQEAVAALRESVAKNPDYAWGYFDLARVLCSLNDFPEAEQAIRKAIETRPDLRGVMRGDGEFTRLCRPLVRVLQ